MIINNYIPFNNTLRSVVGSSLPSVLISVHRVYVDPVETSFRGKVSGLAGARYERHICSSFTPNSVTKSTGGFRFLLLDNDSTSDPHDKLPEKNNNFRKSNSLHY